MSSLLFSYGDRQMIASLLRKLQYQSKEQLKQRKPEMIESLKKLGDFVVDLKWDFTSWLPLVSRILPSDICKISKKGASIRLDTTLVDFTEMRWERGDITFLYRGEATTPEDSLFVLDNKLRVYQKVSYSVFRHHYILTIFFADSDSLTFFLRFYHFDNFFGDFDIWTI